MGWTPERTHRNLALSTSMVSWVCAKWGCRRLDLGPTQGAPGFSSWEAAPTEGWTRSGVSGVQRERQADGGLQAVAFQLLRRARPGWPRPPHLSHRYSLRRAALQKDLVIQRHLLCQRLLVKVLAQV